jgi:hypothetical protein
MGSAVEAIYCFGADAADAAADAASAAALAAAAESAAAEAAESGAGVVAAGGGGVVSVVGAGASVLLPQALRISAATKALRASLVFIYRYPRNLMIKRFRHACCLWASTQISRPILECFRSISYLFRHSWSAFNVGNHGLG